MNIKFQSQLLKVPLKIKLYHIKQYLQTKVYMQQGYKIPTDKIILKIDRNQKAIEVDRFFGAQNNSDDMTLLDLTKVEAWNPIFVKFNHILNT